MRGARVVAVVTALAVSAEGAGPALAQSSPNQGTRTAAEAISDLFVLVSVANFIVQNCESQGIRANYSSIEKAIDAGVRSLRASGFDAGQLSVARKAELKRSHYVRADRALDYLYQRGARRQSIPSLCRVGASEMEQGTFVGQLLRRTN